jgi:hypothetical protein
MLQEDNMLKASAPSTTPSETSTDAEVPARNPQPERDLAPDPEVAPFSLESITGGHQAGGSHSPLSSQALSQNPTLAKRGYAEAMRFLEKSGLPGEQIEYIVTTNQTSLSSVTGCAVVTNKRLLTLKMLGLDKPLIDSCLWSEIEDIKLFESVSGVTLVISTSNNTRLTMEALPRHQAQVVVGYGLMHSDAMRKHGKYPGVPTPARGSVPVSQPRLSPADLEPSIQGGEPQDEPQPFVPPGQAGDLNWRGTTSSRLRLTTPTTTSGSLTSPPTGPQSLDDLPIESMMKRKIQSSGGAASPTSAPSVTSSGGSILESIMRASEQVEILPADELGALPAAPLEESLLVSAAVEPPAANVDSLFTAEPEVAAAALFARPARPVMDDADVASEQEMSLENSSQEGDAESDEPTMILREWSEYFPAAETAHEMAASATDDEPFQFEQERQHQYMVTGPIDDDTEQVPAPASPVEVQPTWRAPEPPVSTASAPHLAQTLHDTSGTLSTPPQAQDSLKAHHISTPLDRGNTKSSDDLVQKMKQLKELLEIGIISEDEFKQKKLELLDRL